MPFTTLSSGLTIQIPTPGTKNWAATLQAQCWQKISEHDHTGSGKGLQIGTNALAALAVTAAKIANGTITATQIADDAITLAKIQNVSTNTLLGRDTAGTGDLEQLTIHSSLELLSGELKIATSGVVENMINSSAVTTAKIADANVTLAKLASAVQEALVPAGSIIATARSTAATGYLLCDGSAVSRTTYSSLFAAISTTYGVGDGATTFNLPDLRGRFPLGKASAGTGSTLGGTGGSLDHTHTGPSHTHTIPAHSHSAGSLRADVGTNVGTNENVFFNLDGGSTFTAGRKYSVAGSSLVSDSSTVASCVVHGSTATDGSGTTGSDGTGTTSSANPAFQVVNYMIKT